MAQTSFPLPQWLSYFNTLDSTNNYAMKRIEDGMAKHGEVIWAKRQTQGKGQRGKHWADHEGNLKMTLIIKPKADATLTNLNFVVPIVILKCLQGYLPQATRMSVKWPNDVFINGKKAVGVLIENNFRGMNWNFAAIGIGVNVRQTEFADDLVNATSLKSESARVPDQFELIQNIRAGILNALRGQQEPEELRREYNKYLYLRGQTVLFQHRETDHRFEGTVMGVDEAGKLLVQTSKETAAFAYGSLSWILNKSEENGAGQKPVNRTGSSNPADC